jgi:hypothetical protein
MTAARSEVQAKSETQDFGDFSHEQPFPGHSGPSACQWRQPVSAGVQRQPLSPGIVIHIVPESLFVWLVE